MHIQNFLQRKFNNASDIVKKGMLRDDLYRDMGESKLYQGEQICIDFGLIYWGLSTDYAQDYKGERRNV